jgi:hypothetical protein
MANTGGEGTQIPPMGLGFETTVKDMRFIGWVALIKGILICFSIFGALVGVPLIIASHRLIEGTKRFDLFRSTGTQDELAAGFYELGRSFRILKILVIIYLVLMVGTLAFVFLLGGLGVLAGLLESGGY